MPSGKRLEGKVAIVTGAGTRGEIAGTGQAAAILMAREGAKILLSDIDINNAEEPLRVIKKEGGEGIPVVLMEGMASGLPVIATNCGATSELVRDYLIEERSSSQIAEKINLLANSKDNRKRQGLLNQEIIKKKHSTQNIDFLLDYFKNEK